MAWGKNWGCGVAPGDRRDEDFVTLGKLSSLMFDRIIVKKTMIRGDVIAVMPLS
jgi:hypothetical protein